ncbi:YihY family inner membrane protein [uncultured Candidatus Thioglobus sp.]|jgi:membrane protein|uniref:YihY family inner membrane protein n=1 Tax=uncultured Candidatus Thioglobus sp. TaxID=655186 RepID=UPI001D9F85F5|nr:YihY family inner membrane protein [Candidatus Thioglobus sp.]MBT4181481.1 YihY family inner membrane protein [Candidatus Thioglobus sp.]MBT6279305.1 YihY family inner membrane protein [Candidatus Thioglobus sp.]MBT6752086.1 YihY family inner membrane protein [Candidatus Thioglobus sp.]
MIETVLKRFVKRQGFDSASILSFSSLFALVPGFALGLSVFSLSPYFYDLQQYLEQFLYTQLLPQNYGTAKEYIQQFINQAQSLKGISSSFLIFAVMLLLFEIDKRINLVWHDVHHRHWMRGLISYLFVLFLGPIFVAASLFFSSYVVASDIFSQLPMINHAPLFTPLILSSVGFSILYYAVPLEKVRYINALKAGVIAAILLEIIKYAMFVYIQYFPIYEFIYGTLSILMLLMIWIYLAWLIVLLGASFCYCFENKE